MLHYLKVFPQVLQHRVISIPLHPLTLLFLGSLALFVALIPAPRIDGQLIGSDGVSYYVYVRSLVIDGDLDFRNENAYFDGVIVTTPPTPTGLPGNKHAIGPALLWMPFFLVAHLIALSGHALGFNIATDGYSYLYQAAISIGSICYGALGFVMASTCARRLFTAQATTWAVALLWLASNAFYYMVFESSMAHMVSLFSVALLMTVWFLGFWQRQPTLLDALLLGIASGIVLLVRLQDGFVLLVPYGFVAWCAVRAALARDWRGLRHWVLMGVVAAIMTVVVFTPQLLAWRQLYGSWLAIPMLNDYQYAGQGVATSFFWLQPKIGGVLFSTFHGLFSWHPIFLFATLGLVAVARRERGVAASGLLLVALNTYIVASWWGWTQGDAFGGRMFLGMTWVWVLGLAGLLDSLRTTRWYRVALSLGLALIAWNALALVQYRLGFVSWRDALTWKEMTIDRLMLPWALIERYLL